MPIESLDHLYAETHDWEASVAFWEGLGFSFAEQWGSEGHRAGRLEAGEARVVLAEVSPDHAPAFNAFFLISDPDGFGPGESVEVDTPLQDTHWGTRWIRVVDPERRIHVLEEPPGG